MPCPKTVQYSHQPPIGATSPPLSGFALYAERSLRLGPCGRVQGGDVGVHAVAERQHGIQLVIGDCSVVDTCRNVYAPRAQLGRHVSLGVTHCYELQDDQVALRAPLPFPAATMPAAPLAPLVTAGTTDVTVAPGELQVLLPGAYAAAMVSGTLLLNPGEYSFATMALTDGARLVAIAGQVDLRVAADLAAGRHVRIFPAFGRAAATFSIRVGGQDPGGLPAISLGECSRVRALVAAPCGTLAIADRTHLTGAAAAFDIAIGAACCVDFQDGFPAEAPGQRGSQPLQGYYGPHPDPTVAPLVGPLPPDTIVPLSIGLPVRDPAGLAAFVDAVSDPNSPLFRQYLTLAQFTATYGATATDYQAVQDWATAAGLSVYATFPNNLLLCVSGTAAQIGQALHANLTYRLQDDGVGQFVAVDREPSLDLTVTLLRINGLTEFRIPHHTSVQGTGGCPGPGCGFSWRAADIRNAYLGSDPSILATLDGTGQAVGLLELNSFATSDIAGYDALQIPSLNPANVQLFSIAAPPPFTSYTPNNETVLDIQMVQAMAPNAQVLVFQTALGATLHGDAVLHAMATSNPPLGSASCSYIFGRSANAEQALALMAAVGTSFFQSSGDYGDVGDPQSNQDMLPQTLVGGTILNSSTLTTPFPKPTYPPTYYAGEATWNQATASKAKSVTGGGVMDGNNKNGQCYCWPYSLGPFSCCGSGVRIPSWQLATMQTTAAVNGGSTAWRNFPDVAMLAANIEIFYQGQATTQGGGGTSAATPLWAGFVALINQRIKLINPAAPLAGFLNRTLYDIGRTTGLADDLYALCFNDIQGGSNANGFGPGFQAVQGYDLCTGLGTPKVGLIYQISSPKPLTKNQPLDMVTFVIGTGEDNLRGNGGFGTGCKGTGCTADILFSGFDLATGRGVMTVTLKQRNTDEEFAKNSVFGPVDFPIRNDNAGNPIPLPTQAQGIVGVRLNIQQGDNTSPCGPDNWDVTTLSVSLFDPVNGPAASVCQLNLVGTATLQDGHTGLVRLSESAGKSGVGPTSPIFTTGPGSGC